MQGGQLLHRLWGTAIAHDEDVRRSAKLGADGAAQSKAASERARQSDRRLEDPSETIRRPEAVAEADTRLDDDPRERDAPFGEGAEDIQPEGRGGRECDDAKRR